VERKLRASPENILVHFKLPVPLVPHLVLVGEDGVGLDELLGEAVVDALQDEGAHPAPRSARDRVAQHEALCVLISTFLAETGEGWTVTFF